MRILLILAAFLMIGCSAGQTTEKANTRECVTINDGFTDSDVEGLTKAENVEKSARTNSLVMERSTLETSHICKAKTKTGGRCARRVSNQSGLTTYCFMHRGDAPAE